MNIAFAVKAFQELAIFRYGGFEFEAVGRQVALGDRRKGGKLQETKKTSSD